MKENAPLGYAVCPPQGSPRPMVKLFADSMESCSCCCVRTEEQWREYVALYPDIYDLIIVL